MRRIGLTGGIGSGKSAVAGMLGEFGACIVDTDAIARQISAPGGLAIPALRERFGDEAIDATGALDRDRMRTLAFADPGTRTALEAVLHPLIGAEAERQAAAARPDQSVVFDVPLLVESGRWRARVERVLVVDCTVETQIERVMRRSGWERVAVERVIAQQASREARRAAADAVIHNDGGMSLDELRQALYTLWQRWRL
ncbi:dephospho-CoA kinase [Methylibium rhizosphaerae]|uniref:dephospho-CoA kinase n=1 Tax=Methylibium rhizosphaerae TaxID=2570323 RepID=UPI00112C353C|nr:dephospho-CoA kinase [Methylibium rhizosphaerae]